MKLLNLIKNRKTIRKYKNKKISKNILNKILAGGVWGPSVAVFQPWKIVALTNPTMIDKIHNIIANKVEKMGVVGTVLLKATARATKDAPAILVVYKTGEFEDFASRFGKKCSQFSKLAELSAISASIQNILLVAESLRVGACWHDTPLFCESKINKLLKEENKLVAVITLGYPAEKGNRAPRKDIEKMIRYIDDGKI